MACPWLVLLTCARSTSAVRLESSEFVSTFGNESREPFVDSELIASGAEGRVYRARDASNDEIVAFKQPTGSSPSYKVKKEVEFYRAAKARMLSNDLLHFVKAEPYPADCDRDCSAIVYTWGGESLRAVLWDSWSESTGPGKCTRTLSQDEQLSAVRQLLSAVYAMSLAGISHNDLKPGNVMVLRDPAPIHVRLTDYGFGFTGPELDGVQGTPPYIPPEKNFDPASWQKNGLSADEITLAKMDRWALGAIIADIVYCPSAGPPGLLGLYQTIDPGIDWAGMWLDKVKLQRVQERLKQRAIEAEQAFDIPVSVEMSKGSIDATRVPVEEIPFARPLLAAGVSEVFIHVMAKLFGDGPVKDIFNIVASQAWPKLFAITWPSLFRRCQPLQEMAGKLQEVLEGVNNYVRSDLRDVLQVVHATYPDFNETATRLMTALVGSIVDLPNQILPNFNRVLDQTCGVEANPVPDLTAYLQATQDSNIAALEEALRLVSRSKIDVVNNGAAEFRNNLKMLSKATDSKTVTYKNPKADFLADVSLQKISEEGDEVKYVITKVTTDGPADRAGVKMGWFFTFTKFSGTGGGDKLETALQLLPDNSPTLFTAYETTSPGRQRIERACDRLLKIMDSDLTNIEGILQLAVEIIGSVPDSAGPLPSRDIFSSSKGK